MAYLYANYYIIYAFSIVAFMLSTSLIHDIYKEHQIAIRRAKFQFWKKASASIWFQRFYVWL